MAEQKRPGRTTWPSDFFETNCATQDVAEHMQVSVRTIRRWISDGKLRAVKLPSGKYGKSGVRIPLSALKEAGFGIIINEQQPDNNSKIETGDQQSNQQQ